MEQHGRTDPHENVVRGLVQRWMKHADVNHDQKIDQTELAVAQRVAAYEIEDQRKTAMLGTTVFAGLALASVLSFQVIDYLMQRIAYTGTAGQC